MGEIFYYSMMPVGAIFSEDRKYRYALWRIWDTALPKLQFIGLNPSKAGEYNNDNTITKLIKITRNNGFGGFYMTNLFGIISPKPEILLTDVDPIGDNDRYLTEFSPNCTRVVFAWGNFKEAYACDKRTALSYKPCRADQVISMFEDHNKWCLAKNKSGSPKHPLYCLDNQKLIKW